MARAISALAILAGWVASLLLPVADSQHFDYVDRIDGWSMLKIGWLGPLILQFGWLANLIIIPALGVAAGQYGEAPRTRLALGIVLALLVINSLFWSQVPDDAGQHKIVAYHSGYWVWICSMAAAATWLIAEPILRRAQRRRSSTESAS